MSDGVFYVSAAKISGSKSADKKCAYILREKSYKTGLDPAVYRACGNMPLWASGNPVEYFRRADKGERRNGRRARDYIFAFQVDIPPLARVKMLKQIVSAMAHEGLPWAGAIHAGHGYNPHAHLLISERINDGQNRGPDDWFRRHPIGARKSAQLEHKRVLISIRKSWADLSNIQLAAVGSDVRVDHRRQIKPNLDPDPNL